MSRREPKYAEDSMWCRGCPNLIYPGDEYVDTGDPEMPHAHIECRGREWRDGEGVLYQFGAFDDGAEDSEL